MTYDKMLDWILCYKTKGYGVQGFVYSMKRRAVVWN